MRRLLVLVAAAAVLAPVAAAQSGAHFTKNGQPVCRDIGTQLQCTGELAGLGNEDLVINVSATALVSAVCISPGGNEAPGQNKVLRGVSGTQTIPGGAIKNGRASFSTTTNPPPTPTAQQAGCPNPNWRTRITDVSFSNIRLTISQGGQLLFTCTAPSPGTLSCTPAS